MYYARGEVSELKIEFENATNGITKEDKNTGVKVSYRGWVLEGA